MLELLHAYDPQNDNSQDVYLNSGFQAGERMSHRVRKSSFNSATTPLAIKKPAIGKDTKSQADHDALGFQISKESATARDYRKTLASISNVCNLSG